MSRKSRTASYLALGRIWHDTGAVAASGRSTNYFQRNKSDNAMHFFRMPGPFTRNDFCPSNSLLFPHNKNLATPHDGIALTCVEYCRRSESLQPRAWLCNSRSNRTTIDAYLHAILMTRKSLNNDVKCYTSIIIITSIKHKQTLT